MSPKTCYRIAALLLLSGAVHLAILLISGGTWSGPLSWRKPATFGLSFGLTLITIAWLASYLPIQARTRRWLLTAFSAACTGEVALITVQAWRHVPSHFNMETPLDTAIARVLAAGGAVIIIVIATMTTTTFRHLPPTPPSPPLAPPPPPSSSVPPPSVPPPARLKEPLPLLSPPAVSSQAPLLPVSPSVAPSMRLALQAGFLALDSALVIGAVMIAIGVTDVASGDQQAAYEVGTQWKPAHFVPMHGVLALPLLAWLLTRTALPERARVRIVAVAAAGYGALCALAIAESIAGIDPLHAPLPANAAAVAAVLAILVAAAQTLAALRHAPAGAPPAGVASVGAPPAGVASVGVASAGVAPASAAPVGVGPDDPVNVVERPAPPPAAGAGGNGQGAVRGSPR